MAASQQLKDTPPGEPLGTHRLAPDDVGLRDNNLRRFTGIRSRHHGRDAAPNVFDVQVIKLREVRLGVYRLSITKPLDGVARLRIRVTRGEVLVGTLD
ncbi:hypothetical protein D3C73_1392780 [compost metagenome]